MTRAPRVGPAFAGGALALALLLSACSGGSADPRAAAEPLASAAAAGPFAAGGLQDPRERADVAPAATPTRLRIPAIGVDSVLGGLALGPDGALEAPVDYDLAGWYAGGVVPGAIGPAIVAGHVDSPTAPAVFARIDELVPGDEILVSMSDGAEVAFAVTGAAQSAKSQFPSDAVYSNVPAPELRLITCAGAFDSAIGHYTDNLIVFAALRATP
ncbi:MAG: class F sortase [Microbacterium sp.]